MAAILLVLASGCAPPVEFEPRDFVCAAGESPPCETTEPAGTWVHPEGDGEDLDGETRRYIVHVVSVPSSQDGRGPGFNLDGVLAGDTDLDETTPCTSRHADLDSSVDRGHVGVDNVFGDGLVETIEGLIGSDVELCPNGMTGCLDDSIRSGLAAGSFPLLITVRDLDSLRFDDSVHVEVARGIAPAELALVEGRIASEQVFEVAEVLSETEGSVFDGRLRTTGAEFVIWPDVGGSAVWGVHDAELRFDFDADGLARGAVGGLLSVVELAYPCSDCPSAFDTLAVLESFADIGLDETRGECAYISLGATFEATPVR